MATYKCVICKTSNIKEIAEKSYKDEETRKIMDKRYCIKHYEEMMNKRAVCSECGKSFVRRWGVERLVTTRIVKGVAKKKPAYFCSESCVNRYEEEMECKELFIKEFMEYHHYKETSEINKIIFIQMSTLGQKYNLCNKGMLYTLRYLKIQGIKIEEDSIWSIIQNYDNARRYFTDINRRNRELEESKSVVSVTHRFKLPCKTDKNKRLGRLLYLPND